ncbi:MAG: response regulator transcription factor [Planctomycetales bacterium]
MIKAAMSTATIVVVEDEPAIRRGVCDALRATGYQVVEASDGAEGLESALVDGVDLVLLDLLLPKMDGLDVLTRIRSRRSKLPVIILTARGTEDDRVRGLRMGADDYVVKPFSARELLARVEAVMRRSGGNAKGTVLARLGRGVIDLERREVRWIDQERVSLSETEVTILSFLLANRDRAVSREELLSRVWGIDSSGIETRTIDMHVARLRSKLKDPSLKKPPEAVVTVRSQGYMAGADLKWEDD